ncbi:hypothetical protein U0070_020088, partial [Myodes glareolus]
SLWATAKVLILGYDRETLENCDKFVIRDEDTVILTYPKSGTNWMIEIISLIQTKGNPKWIQSVPIWERSPWLECQYGYELSIMIYGSWFEHTRDWLSMRERENFLLLSYEEMKKDTRKTIEKICDFLGKKLETEELDLVLKHSSFQAMNENNMSNFSLIPQDVVTNGLKLLRKGITGDWKNHFTVAQAEVFDKVFQEKMYDKERIEEIPDKFVIRDEDTVILTYLKSGTNWLIEILCLILTKGNPKWIQSVPIWECSPLIETQLGYPIYINKEGPWLIISYLPIYLFSKSFFISKA